MKTIVTQFHPCQPKLWNGRYARIPGDGPVFHLLWLDGRWWPAILWDTEDGRATCKALRCDASSQLADAVAHAKRRAGCEGGAFAINEFGQVIVPASGSTERYLVGRLDGRLLFENPFCRERPIDLGDNAGLQPGDPWKLPYVGIPYNLHRAGHIYFYRLGENGGASELPPRQDPRLVRALRDIRPRGPVRFIVNPAGLVLTKSSGDERQNSEEDWQPIYIGSISFPLWFTQE